MSELDEAVELIYDRVDGSYCGLNRGYIRTVLQAAQEEFDHDYAADTVICLDCQHRGIPSCDRDGHGLVTLRDLMENYC